MSNRNITSMTEDQMLAFIEDNVTEQGNEGAINLTPLLLAMVEQMFKEPLTGVAPIVVKIGANGEKRGTRTTYPITTNQSLLDAYIRSANEMKEKTRLFVEDNGVLIGFNQIEIDELSITGHVALKDGESGVVISTTAEQSYFYHDEKIIAIPQVTIGEIEAYKKIFNANYDKIENMYKLVVGATEVDLTPAEMIIVNEEYNKTSTDANYTAMWANSIAKYICCAPWFDGFPKFNLHSAFHNSKEIIYIDLNKPTLNVSDITGAFSGCERLEQISGILGTDSQTRFTEAFKGCGRLRVFKLHGLDNNLDLSDCPMLAYEVFEYMIANSTSKSITVYVHQQVMDNIDNNVAWTDVKNALAAKPTFRILAK